MRKEIDRKALYFIGPYDYAKTLKIAIGTFSWTKSVGLGVQLHIFCGDYPAANAQADEVVALADERGTLFWKASHKQGDLQ
jgi:hypothetical protein